MSSEPKRVNGEGPETVLDEPVFDDVAELFTPVAKILGRKWHPIVLYRLFEEEPLGFAEMKQRIEGVSSKMLSESLSDLEKRGLIEREIVSEKPVRVEYALTDRGRTLDDLLVDMLQWSREHSAPESTTEAVSQSSST